jgi:hypothetical protein
MELSELLSGALVAFTIEVDNEFEARMPHHTTQERRRSSKRPGKGRAARGERGPWLVSLAMFENCLRWLPEDGLTVGELEGLARTPTNLDGMRRWGYVGAESPRGGRVAKPGQRTVLRATEDGRAAAAIWRPLPSEVEARWRQRFGDAVVASARRELAAAVEAIEGTGAGASSGATSGPLPDTMPIVGYGLATRPRKAIGAAARPEPEPLAELALHALLARLLTAFALAYEAEARISLALGANILAVLGPEPVRLRDLPSRAGVAKEPVAAALKFLAGRGLAAVALDPVSGRGKVACLTAAGERAKEDGGAGRARIEADWGFGGLVAALEPIAGDPTASSPLFAGLEPPARGWRAALPKPERLPRFPLVTHRGGFPDGS